MPCVPVTVAPWEPGAVSVTIMRMPALTNTCMCNCVWGGVITFTEPGQFHYRSYLAFSAKWPGHDLLFALQGSGNAGHGRSWSGDGRAHGAAPTMTRGVPVSGSATVSTPSPDRPGFSPAWLSHVSRSHVDWFSPEPVQRDLLASHSRHPGIRVRVGTAKPP